MMLEVCVCGGMERHILDLHILKPRTCRTFGPFMLMHVEV